MNLSMANYGIWPNLEQFEHFDSMPACATWPFFSSIYSSSSADLQDLVAMRSVIAESVLVKHQLLILNRLRTCFDVNLPYYELIGFSS